MSALDPLQPVTLLITAESLEQARAISQALLNARAVACANLVPGVESHYWWKGNLESATETLIMAKTLAHRIEQASNIVRRIHTYEVYELIALPIVDGSPEYLAWIAKEVG